MQLNKKFCQGDSSIADSCDLHSVVRSGDEVRLRELLDSGNHSAGINSLNKDGDTPLHCADFAKPEIVSLLLKHGADVHLADLKWQSALHLAVTAKCIESVRMLLDAGANVKLSNGKGESALRIAVQLNLLEIAKLLIDRGAAAYLINEIPGRVLRYAVCNNNEAMVELILEYGPDLTTLKNPGSISVLAWAIHTSDEPSIARRLIERGADVNEKCESQPYSIIHLAVLRGHLNQMKLLAENGVDLSVRVDLVNVAMGLSLVHLAALHRTENSRRLLEYFVEECGLDPLAKTQSGSTALHLAAMRNTADVLEYLMDRAGLRLDERDSSNGKRALDYAVSGGNVEACDFLLRRGADASAKDYRGSSPLIRAVCWKRAAVLELLLEHGAKVTEVILNGSFRRRTEHDDEIKEVLLRHLAKLDCVDPNIDAKVREIVTEMKKMREIKIFEGVSLLDIAIQNKAVISGYARNEALARGFEDKKKHETDFPRLYGLMADRFERFAREIGKQRALRIATDRLSEILPLVVEVIRKIVGYLEEDDLSLFKKRRIDQTGE